MYGFISDFIVDKPDSVEIKIDNGAVRSFKEQNKIFADPNCRNLFDILRVSQSAIEKVEKANRRMQSQNRKQPSQSLQNPSQRPQRSSDFDC